MTDTLATDFLIDSDKERIRIPEVVYPLMVNPANMRTDINIPLVNYKENEKPELLFSGTQEEYNLPLATGVNYSAFMIRQLDMTLNITGIRYSQNKTFNYLQFQAPFNESPTTVNANDYTGLPHPYLPGIFGPPCDILSSMLSSSTITVGSNNQEVGITLTPAEVNVYRKMTSHDVLEEGRYRGLLYPETVNLDIMQYPANRKEVLPFAPVLEQWEMPLNNAVGQKLSPFINGDKRMKTLQLLSYNTMTLDEINQEPTNMLSIYFRGQIFKLATYVFSKAAASPNYKIIFDSTHASDGGKFATIEVDGANTTILYTMKIGNYCFPTNISNWQECLANGISPYTLFWYYNKNPLLYNVVGSGAPVVYSYAYDDSLVEPTTQSLTTTILFTKLESPVINPIFNDSYTKSVTNISQMTVKCVYQTAIEKMFRIIGAAGSTVTYGGSLANSNGNTSYAIANTNVDGLLTAKFTNQRIIYFQNQLGLLQNNTMSVCALPYMFRKTFNKSISTLVQAATVDGDSKNWRNFDKVTVYSDSIPIGGSVPRYFLSYVDIPISYKITGLSVLYNGGDVQLLSMASLRRATISNGMINYTAADDSQGYTIMSNASAGLTISEQPKLDNFQGKGTILFLDFGNALALPENVVPGATGLDFSVQYKFTIEFSPEYVGELQMPILTPVNGQLVIEHLSESELRLSENVGSLSVELISPLNSAKAMETMKQRIINNRLYINKKKLYSGAGFVSDIFHKARHVIPKLDSAYKSAKGVIDTGKKAVETTANVLNTAAKAGSTLSSWMT